MPCSFKKLIVLAVIIMVLVIMPACGGESDSPALEESASVPIPESTASPSAASQPALPPNSESATPVAADAVISAEEVIQPDELVYQGAFRLPDEYGEIWGDQINLWGYSGYASAFYPDGDGAGPDDGYPGSLYAVGHDQAQYVSEISIPIPVKSKTVSDLNTAVILQGFTDLAGDMFGYLEIPRAGLEYLPPQGEQSIGKLHFCWGQHFQFERVPSHGWCELDLSEPQIAGPWILDGYTNYVINDYLFEIPEQWASANVSSQRLATGRFRDGHWSGLGPALFTCSLWDESNPPSPDTTLQNVTPLLLYGVQEPGAIEITIDDTMKMQSYAEADEWSGGAWLTADDRSAVIFIGTKATGENWYGFSNGVVYPIDGSEFEGTVPDWPYDDRGWWSEGVEAQILFYNPDDLAAVARGEMETWEPQPYATMLIDDYLFDPGFDHERAKRYLVGACSFDRENGLLYVFERMAEEDEKSLVHVWRVK